MTDYIASSSIDIKKPGFTGCLFIDINTSYNRLLLRFLFDREEELRPLIVTIEAEGRVYQYLCDRIDTSNPEIKSVVIKPEYKLSGGIKIVNIRPLAEAELS